MLAHNDLDDFLRRKRAAVTARSSLSERIDKLREREKEARTNPHARAIRQTRELGKARSYMAMQEKEEEEPELKKKCTKGQRREEELSRYQGI